MQENESGPKQSNPRAGGKMNFVRKAILSFGGLGYGPIAPGTWGSGGAAVIYAAMRLFWTDDLKLLAIACSLIAVAFFLVTVLFGEWAERTCGEKDPCMVVTDEVSGYFVTAIFIVSGPWWLCAGAAFVFFRIFDIVKLWPASAAEKLGGGLGIALDDVIAGAYACICANFAVYAAVEWLKIA